MRYGENVGRDEYPVTTTSDLDLLIHTERGISGNQQYPTYENCGGRGDQQQKVRIGYNFDQLQDTG